MFFLHKNKYISNLEPIQVRSMGTKSQTGCQSDTKLKYIGLPGGRQIFTGCKGKE